MKDLKEIKGSMKTETEKQLEEVLGGAVINGVNNGIDN